MNGQCQLPVGCLGVKGGWRGGHQPCGVPRGRTVRGQLVLEGEGGGGACIHDHWVESGLNSPLSGRIDMHFSLERFSVVKRL